MANIFARNQARIVSVRCTHCGDTDQITDRSFRRKAAEGKPHLCRVCRAVRSIEPSEEDFAYWKARFSQEEINEMVGSILG